MDGRREERRRKGWKEGRGREERRRDGWKEGGRRK